MTYLMTESSEGDASIWKTCEVDISQLSRKAERRRHAICICRILSYTVDAHQMQTLVALHVAMPVRLPFHKKRDPD